MNDFTFLDLFFIVLSGAIIFLTILAAVLLTYLILFFRSLRKLTKHADTAAKIATEEIKELSKQIKSNGFSFRSIINFLFGLSRVKTKTKHSK